MLVTGEQRPVEGDAIAARQFFCRGVEQQAIDLADVFPAARQRARILEADGLPHFIGQAAADAPDPFGRFTAVKLDDVGLDRVERAPGQFGIGIDHQQHHLGLAAGLLAQFPRQV